MNPADVPELQPVWAAIRRGTELHRLRVLAVGCVNDHLLVHGVFRTGRGPVAVGKTRTPDVIRPAGDTSPDEPEVAGWFSRDQWHAVNLDDQDVGDVVTFQCRCREARIPVCWLREQLASGRRRVQWTDVRT